ncbi:MAG: ABC transporter permease, partial [Acidimicrobiia bacterium]|nr:ABC transporter permease [Acidimicrobiia bacterium]
RPMKLLAIASTGVNRMFRDRSNYFFVFVLPLGIIIIIGSLFGSGFRPTVGVVAPETGVGEILAQRLGDIEGVDIQRYDSVDDLVQAVERSSIQAGVSIPDDIDQTLARGDDAGVGFVARPDSSGPQLRALVDAVVTDLAYEVVSTRIADTDLQSGIAQAQQLETSFQPVTVETDVVGEATVQVENVGQFELGAVTQLVLFMFLTGLTGSAALIQSRQLGVSRRMLSTPTGVTTIITGEALGRLGVVAVQGIYIVAVTWVAFGVDWGDPLGAAAVMVLFGLTAAGAAMLMGSVFRNDQQAGGMGVLFGLGLAALGGAMTPVEIMPPVMQQVSKAIPHSWAIDAFSVLIRQDGTIVDIGRQLGVLAAFAAVFLAFAAWRFRAVLTRGN